MDVNCNLTGAQSQEKNTHKAVFLVFIYTFWSCCDMSKYLQTSVKRLVGT